MSMTVKRRTMSILSPSRQFYNGWRNFERRKAGLLNCCSFNLKMEQPLFIGNVGSSRYMSLARHAVVSEADVKKFLNHLSSGQNIKFKKLLDSHAIKRLIDERIKIVDYIENLDDMGTEDKEMKKMVEEERQGNEDQLKEIDEELITLIMKDLDRNYFNEIILEITSGVGGTEAMLFVGDLLQMYEKHLTYLGYDYDIIELAATEKGGIRYVSIMISGEGAFKRLRHEAGVHRVQRVPSTETSGRIHTSVVSVAVLPQPNEIQVKIDPKDIKVETMRASGAGGQHVNTTDSAVRLTHLPTGIITTCQVGKSQINNRKLAMAKLRALIYEVELNAQLKNTTNLRKKQMGMGERNERIRTYNYIQNRITDHRIDNGTFHSIDRFFGGGEDLNELHDRLDQELQHKVLLDAVKTID